MVALLKQIVQALADDAAVKSCTQTLPLRHLGIPVSFPTVANSATACKYSR